MRKFNPFSSVFCCTYPSPRSQHRGESSLCKRLVQMDRKNICACISKAGRRQLFCFLETCPTAQPKYSWPICSLPAKPAKHLELERSSGRRPSHVGALGKPVPEGTGCPSPPGKHHLPPFFLPETKFTLRKSEIGSHSKLQHAIQKESHLLILFNTFLG